MKILTITWITYKNFGTYLQAYALQQVLLKLGYDNMIADDSLIIKSREKFSIFFLIKKIGKTIIVLISSRRRKFYFLQYKSFKMYDEFKKKYLCIDYNTSNLSKLGKDYDVYLCGSDQIWFPSDKIFNPFYYLNFTQKKKIAYAPSIGTVKYPDLYKCIVKPLLEKFSFIGVREKIGAEILRTFISKDIDYVLDPTLLLSSDNWENIASQSISISKNYPYIICYFLTKNKFFLNAVIKYANEHDLKIKIFGTNFDYIDYGDEILCCGPKEFLNEIMNASVVFTDSFHATIFSLQFEKEFYTFKRFKEKDDMNQNSRLYNLLSIFDLSERFLAEEDIDKIGKLPVIDFVEKKRILYKERERSITLLVNALKD